MRTLQIIEKLRRNPDAGPADHQDPHQAPGQLVRALLEEEPPPGTLLCEASVHRSRRSRIYVATFTGASGGQAWKTTGLTDYDQALKLAHDWEAQARAQRVKQGRRLTQPGTRVRHARTGTGIGLTQKEVAKILNMTERGVRAVEHRALAKLRNHPALRLLWQQYLSGELDESGAVFTPAEIAALFDLADTPDELRVIEKVVQMVGL